MLVDYKAADLNFDFPFIVDKSKPYGNTSICTLGMGPTSHSTSNESAWLIGLWIKDIQFSVVRHQSSLTICPETSKTFSSSSVVLFCTAGLKLVQSQAKFFETHWFQESI